MVERAGIPLVIRLSAANQNEVTLLEAMVQAVPTIAKPVRKKRPGRPRQRPGKLHADKGYDSNKARRFLRKKGIQPRIARRGIESSEKLGKHRWVVERTFAWLNTFRRLRIRYERRDDIHLAFLLIGCTLICWNYLIH